MKKNLIAVAVLASSVFAVTAAAAAADGQVDFVGKITDDACVVTNNPGSPLQVNLGEVATTSFNVGGVPTAGVKSSATNFTIKLTGCPAAATQAAVKFDGIAVSGDNTVLALAAGGATGVGIQLSDDANTVVPLFTASKAYPLAAGNNDLNFVARYISTSATITSGVANSTASFTLNYN
ncbi:S-fimbrillin [Serratia fonticola]|uniref:S-fimbrillin n=1 Tax=Serratia fonticola TaxID=47917 RepID=A0A4U9UHT8_SERFO|nr:S-fimbrillin [Serratia fonticola]